jgi:hypothetical protein
MSSNVAVKVIKIPPLSEREKKKRFKVSIGTFNEFLKYLNGLLIRTSSENLCSGAD